MVFCLRSQEAMVKRMKQGGGGDERLRWRMMILYLRAQVLIRIFFRNKYLQQQQLQQGKLIKIFFQEITENQLHHTTRRLIERNRKRSDRAHLSCSQQKQQTIQINIYLTKLQFYLNRDLSATKHFQEKFL